MNTHKHEEPKHATHHAKPREDAAEVGSFVAEAGWREKALELVEGTSPDAMAVSQGGGHWVDGWEACKAALRAALAKSA